jgi:queuosine biosynthesis protein QueC
MDRAVAILSGGVDSSTLLFQLVKSQQFDEVHAITFIYGQKHHKEIESARKIATLLGIEHKIVDLSDLKNILQSALTSKDKEIPNVAASAIHYETLKDTIVPNRNAIFLAIAVGYAKSINASVVYYGAHYSDRGVYPDCRKEFVDSFQEMVSLATGDARIRVEAPFMDRTKTEIVQMGIQLQVPYELTWSCYAGSDIHCGKCSSCRERKQAFDQAEIPDPIEYSQSIRVSEIFASIQGEGPNAGKDVVFLRTALCNLKCSWCDTKYTWDWQNYDYNQEVRQMDTSEIEKEVTRYGIKHLVLTGGEPLIQQKNLFPLLKLLKEDHGFFIEVETNGTIVPSKDMQSIIHQWNVSPKTTNSGNPAMLTEIPEAYEVFRRMPNSFFKYVVNGSADIDEIENLIMKYHLPRNHVILMPEASTKEALASKCRVVGELAKRWGYLYSGRIHIEMWGNQRGK